MPSRLYTRFSKQCHTPIDTYTRLCNDKDDDHNNNTDDDEGNKKCNLNPIFQSVTVMDTAECQNSSEIGDWRLFESANGKLLFQRRISDNWYTAVSLKRTLADAQVKSDTFLAVNDVNVDQ